MGSTKSPAPWSWDVSIDRGKAVPVENGVGIIDKREEAAKHLKDFVVEVTSAEFLEEVAAPKPPAKPADIKVSVVNGESEPLLVTIRDAMWLPTARSGMPTRMRSDSPPRQARVA